MRAHSKKNAIARMADCPTLAALKTVWESLDPDLQAMLVAEKEQFKKGLQDASQQ